MSEMRFDKVVMLLPEVKKVSLGAKPLYKGDICIVKTNRGKKISIPKISVLLQDKKSLIYSLPRRKLIKGEFRLIDGFFVDAETGVRVNGSVMMKADEPVVKTKEQKKKDKERSKKLREGLSKSKLVKDEKEKKVKKKKKK